jgi:Protein of unknown function (DUF1064)
MRLRQRTACPICGKAPHGDLWKHIQRCHKRHSPKSDKPNKFRNQEVEVNGIHFQSKKEAGRWLELQEWQRQGKIIRLQRQVPFDLVVNDQLVCRYFADFCYTIQALGGDGPYGCAFLHEVVEDVKSDHTRRLSTYRLKRKLMLACRGIQIREV